MRERRINLAELMPLFEEKLAAGGEVLFSPSGTSMLPTLEAGRDTLVFVSPPPKLKKYDIALFQAKNGQYVLHRVISVGKTYTFAGDNRFVYEKNIAAEQIIALCAAYIRDGKRVRLDSFSSRMFARLWHYMRPLRRTYRTVLRRLKSLFGG